MRSILKRSRFAALSATAITAVTAFVVFVPMSGASAATTLSGDWAPFTRCPVEDPAMLAADGQTDTALCVASDSPSGSITLGSITAPTGDSNLQFGVVENVSAGTFTVVSPPGGALVTAPVQIPGGLLGLMCPSSIPAVTAVCQEITDSQLNTVTAVVQPAGNPSDFSLDAGLTTGVPIITVPVKIQLQNPLLGSDCYLGSDSNPIVLHPQNLTAPSVKLERFDANGTPDSTNGVMAGLYSTGGTQGDNSAAIPGATGCGLLGILDPAVDLKTGLPSPAGSNSLVLNDASAYLAGLESPVQAAPNDGHDLAAYWNSAVQP